MALGSGRRVAIIGAGTTGGGWAVRFALMGWRVRIHDPDHAARARVEALLESARAALPGLYDTAPPEEGEISFHDSPAEAAEGAEWIQESVPERLELKREVLGAIQQDCDAEAIIGSSSALFRPQDLCEDAARPGQIVVVHPIDPVQLIPLVEVAAGPNTGTARIERIRVTLRDIGAHPLFSRREGEAPIAARLHAALWREALCLIAEKAADTAEIDDAIRYGPGLCWAQGGLFETARIAGGEGGMRQVLARAAATPDPLRETGQDAPDLSGEFAETIVSQSDAQSGRRSAQALQRIRDANLVSILRMLKARDWGAGRLLRATDRRIDAAPRSLEAMSLTAPLPTGDRVVPLDWGDSGGRMTEHHGLQAFGDATDRFLALVGCDDDYLAGGLGFFTAETHVRHLARVQTGARIAIDTQLLLAEGRRVRVFHRMWEGPRLAATAEHMLVHVDLDSRRAVMPASEVQDCLARLAQAHAHLPRPEGAGAAVGRPLSGEPEEEAEPQDETGPAG